jgi:hypothetical protein
VPITPIEPTMTRAVDYGPIDLADLNYLTGIAVTTSVRPTSSAAGGVDFDGDGEIDYEGFALGFVDMSNQSFTPCVLLGDAANRSMWSRAQRLDLCGRHRHRCDRYDPDNGYPPHRHHRPCSGSSSPTTTSTSPASPATRCHGRRFPHHLRHRPHPDRLPDHLEGCRPPGRRPTGLIYVTTFTPPTDPDASPENGALHIYTADGTPAPACH